VIAHQILLDGLKLTVQVLNACTTVSRVAGEHEFQGKSAMMIKALALGLHHHSVFCRRGAGRMNAVDTFDFNNT
jgi:hypothetical protein